MKPKSEEKALNIAKANDIDYEIEKRPLFDEFENKTGYYGLYNPKFQRFMATCMVQYEPVQNIQILKAVIGAIQKFGELDPNEAHIREFHEGGKLFMEIPIKDGHDQFVDGDGITQTLAIIDSKDTTSAFKVAVGYHVWSCENGLYVTRRDWQVKNKHTKSIKEKIAALSQIIPEIMQQRWDIYEKFAEYQRTAASMDLARDMERHLLDHSFEEAKEAYENEELKSRKFNQVSELRDNIGFEMDNKGENLWAILNGVTRWTTHTKSAPRRDNGRLESLAMGTNARVNEKALEFVDRAYFAS